MIPKENSIVQIGTHNAILDIRMFSPDISTSEVNEYNDIVFEENYAYSITPDMVAVCSLQNSVGNKFTYCILKLVIPTNNDNYAFKNIYNSNYIYFTISLTMTTNNELLTRNDILKNTDNVNTFNYTEEFIVKSKQLLSINDTCEAYEFNLISSRWWNFHRNIHYSTKGKKESITTILTNVYKLADLTFYVQNKYTNIGHLKNTELVYSSSANDNLLSIEKFLKHKLFNLNFMKHSDLDILDIFDCIITYNRLTGKYYPWLRPSKRNIEVLAQNKMLPNDQQDIPELEVSITNSTLTSNSQAVLSNKRQIIITKDEQYTKQKQNVYQTYDYDTDNITYSILTQQNKQKIYINDIKVSRGDLLFNIMYPYNYALNERKLEEENVRVIPNQIESNFSKYISTSDDTSNIVNDIETINFDVDNVVIYTLPNIKYDVGNIVMLKFVNSLGSEKSAEAYYLYDDYYIIKTINLSLEFNGYDLQAITLSKLY